MNKVFHCPRLGPRRSRTSVLFSHWRLVCMARHVMSSTPNSHQGALQCQPKHDPLPQCAMLHTARGHPRSSCLSTCHSFLLWYWMEIPKVLHNVTLPPPHSHIVLCIWIHVTPPPTHILRDVPEFMRPCTIPHPPHSHIMWCTWVQEAFNNVTPSYCHIWVGREVLVSLLEHFSLFLYNVLNILFRWYIGIKNFSEVLRCCTIPNAPTVMIGRGRPWSVAQCHTLLLSWLG